MAKGTVVILHGWSRYHQRWQPLKKELQKLNYRVKYFKLPGFKGADLERVWDLKDYVGWVEEKLKKEKINSYFLAGFSNGGRISIGLAAKDSAELKGLVLLNSAGLVAPWSVKKGCFWVLAKTGKIIFSLPGLSRLNQLARRTLYRLVRERDYLEAPPNLASTMKQLIHQDLSSKMKKIKVPTLLLWGGKDRTTPLKDGLKIKSLISRSQLVIFPYASHALPYQNPKGVSHQINQFISS